MRAIVQRVLEASVSINKQLKASINIGLLVFVGIEDADTADDIEWLAKKIVSLRIFDDADRVPNLNINAVNGDILLVSQFTLHAGVKKGNRPRYIKASKPQIAIPLYESLIKSLEKESGKPIFTGTFGADMKVALINDGPITIWMDTKNKE